MRRLAIEIEVIYRELSGTSFAAFPDSCCALTPNLPNLHFIGMTAKWMDGTELLVDQTVELPYTAAQEYQSS